MLMSKPNYQLHPGRSLGSLVIGTHLYDVINTLKDSSEDEPQIDLCYSVESPATKPIVINLPRNGLRLRFDGPEQRLRLIEVLDFARSAITYNGHEIFKTGNSDTVTSEVVGPNYRSIARLFGPTFPGEYVPPQSEDGLSQGTYLMSYPGLAFSFLVDASKWSLQSDLSALVSSSSSMLAHSLAVFEGRSWSEARRNIFASTHSQGRTRSLSNAGFGDIPDEILTAKIHGEGRIELTRASSLPFWITLSETTTQDIVSELGPPDAIYRKNDRRLTIHRTRRSSSHPADKTDTDRSSSYTDESDADDDPTLSLDSREVASAEHFYNYFHLGMDLLIAQPTAPSIPSPTVPEARSYGLDQQTSLPKNHLTVTKLILHSNLPGAWDFNRYRRCQWTMEHVPTAKETVPVTSEMSFFDITERLRDVFSGTYANAEEAHAQQRGMALNRGWGDSPESSCELLGGWEEEVHLNKEKEENADEQVMGSSSELFGFPGMVFEVLRNGAINALTVY